MEPEVFLRTNLGTPLEIASCGECREQKPGADAAAA
jgi:hypothetical protein